MAPPTPTPAPNGTNATPEHRPPPALPPDPSEADIQTGTWLSAESGVVWPSGWNVVIPGLNAKLTATYTFEGQETFADFHRLEGVIHVQGTFAGQDVTGRGYGELVGDPQIKTHK